MIDHIKSTIFVSPVEDHNLLKRNILLSIEKMGRFGMVNSVNNLYNTDWYLNASIVRPYYSIVEPHLTSHNNKVMEYYGYTGVLTTNYWVQQYAKGGFHTWHTHENCTFSNVYYVDFGSSSPKTTFKFRGEEFEVDVAEGSILTFPSYLIHCSKPNPADEIKTVIAFNSNAMYETLVN